MNETLQIILSIIGAISVIGGFIYWHFKTINGFKDQINEIKLQMKDLEKSDALQQQTIDQLNNLFPILSQAIDKIETTKKIENE